MVLAALVIGVVRWALGTDDAPPTSTIPAVTFNDVAGDAADVADVPAQEETEAPTQEETTNDDVAPSEDDALPSSFNLALPFTSQAPTGNWDAVHEETCEEASFLMVTEYLQGTQPGKLDAAFADSAMLALVAYEEARGYGVSITAAEAAAIVNDYYDGVTAEVLENPTVDELRQLIADGYPVIVPAAGRELGNPFFTGEGPLYHMLVIRGYDADHFITNDPGTRHGENYTYDIDVLMSAMGDWNNGNPPAGDNRVVVIRPVVE